MGRGEVKVKEQVMKNGKKKEEDEEAPDYIAQYTSLMTILLAFFIIMLSMGSDKTADYQSGMGYIRNAFGSQGGFGLMPFWRGIWQRNPDIEVEESESEEDHLVGYEKGKLSLDSLDAEGILKAEIQDWGRYVSVTVPISFPENEAAITDGAKEYLKGLGQLFYSLDGYRVTVCAYVSTGDHEADQVLATKRSVLIMRYLRDEYNIDDHRIRSAGYAFPDYLDSGKAEGREQMVTFVVQKLKQS